MVDAEVMDVDSDSDARVRKPNSRHKKQVIELDEDSEPNFPVAKTKAKPKKSTAGKKKQVVESDSRILGPQSPSPRRARTKRARPPRPSTLRKRKLEVVQPNSVRRQVRLGTFSFVYPCAD